MGDMPSRREYRMVCLCGAEFMSTRRDAKHCSHTCASRAHRRRRDAEPAPPGDRACGHCGISISHKRRDARYCSKQCANFAWYHQVQRPERLVDKTSKTCPTCQNAVPEGRHANALYCSLACREVNRRVESHGLSLVEYRSLLDQQGHACAICGCPEVVDGRTFLQRDGWHIDHDHVTGKVRGILCPPCNLLLGYAKDNPSVLQAAIAYLTKESPHG